MTREISNSDAIIDSRDVIKRISELEDERESAIAEDCDHGEECKAQAAHAKDWDASYEGQELKALRALAEEGESLSDWTYGECLIRESYFEDYARQFAEDIGALENCNRWPATCIDWKQAAEELQMDYTSLDFDGVTYYARG